MSKVNNFDVLKEMSRRGMKSIKLANLDNVTNLQATKLGGLVTVAVDSDTIRKMMLGEQLIFAVIVADPIDFQKVKTQLESAHADTKPGD